MKSQPFKEIHIELLFTLKIEVKEVLKSKRDKDDIEKNISMS